MNSKSNQNEGFRILEEFVCEAVPDPSVLALYDQPAATRTEYELDVVVTDPASLSATLVGENGRLRDRIDIGGGVFLSPLFTSIRRAAAVGGTDVLAFVISVPIGIATQFAATALYDWVTKHGIRRMRTNGIEVPVSGTATEAVPAIVKALEDKAPGD